MESSGSELRADNKTAVLSREEWFLWAPVIAAAAYLLWDLQYWWSRMEDYNFGWIVPLFSGYLIYENWSAITKVKRPDRRWYLPAWIFAAFCFGIVSNYKALIGHDQTPSWILAFGTLAVISSAIVATWGWKALRLCLFPLLFLLVAVPLPQSMWGGISQGLQRFVAAVSVEALSFMNIPVLQHGNTLELESGHVAIADACSGIRSLQMSIMVGLLLGKLFLKTYFMRLLIVLLGMMIAIPGNLIRTLWLTTTAHYEGMEAMNAIHDLAGWLVMGATVVGVVVVCILLSWFEKYYLSVNDKLPSANATQQRT
jgi:exosortase